VAVAHALRLGLAVGALDGLFLQEEGDVPQGVKGIAQAVFEQGLLAVAVLELLVVSEEKHQVAVLGVERLDEVAQALVDHVARGGART
jgi:hypothetical protein